MRMSYAAKAFHPEFVSVVSSLLLQQGESLHYVKEQMGHASIQTTVDFYGHLVPGSNRNAVNKLDDDANKNLKIVPAAG